MIKQVKTFRNIAIVVILLAVPVRIMSIHYAPQSGFLGLIYFGKEFKNTRLAEVNKLAPPTLSRWGYDGQFYAQLALDPLLTRHDLAQALDNPHYRARRAGLSLLAYCLGLGKSAGVLQSYAVLNFAFWLLLLGMLGHFIGYRRPRDLLLAVSLLWSTGTLTSVERALTDLPAAVLCVLAVFLGRRWIIASSLLGSAVMVKDTAILCCAAAPWRPEGKRVSVQQLLISGSIMVLPIAVWMLYIQLRLASGPAMDMNNFAIPLAGLITKLGGAFRALSAGMMQHSLFQQVLLLFEVLGPLSLCTQAAYLFAGPRVEDATWRMGIGFGVLLLFLGSAVWAEQFAYCRALLPLTFSFNLLVHKYESGARFAAWYLAGNLGMFWMCFVLFL